MPGISIEPTAKMKGYKGINLNTANNIATGVGIANDFKLGLIEIGSRGTQFSIGMSRYMNLFKGLGIAGSVFTTGYSGLNVYNQLTFGGLNEMLSNRDFLDAGVGLLGLGAVGLTYFGVISNPIGWTIGGGTLIYGGTTFIYDSIYSNP